MIGDKLLTTGSVTFHPDKQKNNSSKEKPSGGIGEDGKYTMRTGNKVGVAPGWYKVTVVAISMKQNTNPDVEPTNLVAEEYADVKTTPLSVEVKENAPAGHYDLKVKPLQK